MTRLLPDTDLLLGTYLNAVLAAGVTVSNHVPADVLAQMPYVRVVRIGGGDTHPQFATNPTVQTDCWASTRAKADDLAEDVRVALWQAWRTQTDLGGGHIARFRVDTAPAELRLPDQLSKVYRYQAVYTLIVRPN